MASVHGSFVPSGTGGFFFLWADSHVQPEQLYLLVNGLPQVNEGACLIQTPARRRTRAVRTHGLFLPIASAMHWLLEMQPRLAGAPLHPSPALRAWSAASRLVLELLVRGRFLPYLRTEAGCLSADWRLCAPEPHDLERIARLEEALPDVCRAVVPPGRSDKAYRPLPAGALLGLFMESAVSALAREFLEGAPMPVRQEAKRDERHRRDRFSAAHHWLLGLTGSGARDLPPGLPDAHPLFEAVEAWAAPVSGTRGQGALRTGVRLYLPEETAHEGWELELVLQTATEPVLTVPAQAVWETGGHDLVIDRQRYAGADQQLLADLTAAARLCPELEPLLSVPAPSRVPLESKAVGAFLQQSVPQLQAAGFPVLLPAGLIRGAVLRAKMHLKPSRAAESRFGLSQLVDVDWELALGGVPFRYDELQGLAARKQLLVQGQAGGWVEVNQKALDAALRNLAPYQERITLGAALRMAAKLSRKEKGQKERAPQSNNPAAGTDEPLAIEQTTTEGWVQELLAKLAEPSQMTPVETPSGFNGSLRPYQQRGLSWLAFMRRYGVGACLADDMGLGKTVQIIALLAHEREREGTDRPTLLVCPVSVVGNWRRELNRFAPGLRVLVHHGASRSESLAEEALKHDVVITTYTVVAREEEQLGAVPWAGIIADEAQNLKNPATRHAQVLLKLPGAYRIAMTGTPVENHLGDLWAIFEFLNPGFLGARDEFQRAFAVPIERHRDQEAAERLKRLVQPFILRRLKNDPAIIEDLPEKLEMSVLTNLTLEQAALYEAVVQQTLERSLEAIGIQRHGAVLAGLTKLKQICNHPSAMTGDNGPLAGRSGKLDRLVEMLEEVLAEGDRALIFTQFAQFGRRLQQYLTRRFGCQVFFLDGSVPRAERDRQVAAFQNGEAPLFILSLKAGGVGLTLTAANHVFHFDRWWNPAIEDQATDRAFRIGQTRKVMVHRMVTAGTLEERIDQLLAEKRDLSSQVFETGEAWLSNLSTEELRALISLQAEP